MRIFICSEPLNGASYGHTKLCFIDGGFVFENEVWGSVDDADMRIEFKKVSKDVAVNWVRRIIKDEMQLHEILARIDELEE